MSITQARSHHGHFPWPKQLSESAISNSVFSFVYPPSVLCCSRGPTCLPRLLLQTILLQLPAFSHLVPLPPRTLSSFFPSAHHNRISFFPFISRILRDCHLLSSSFSASANCRSSSPPEPSPFCHLQLSRSQQSYYLTRHRELTSTWPRLSSLLDAIKYRS